ncbi:hypothetical protein BN8_02137 [Fibrisoma limi BUZ 3]|uniref:Lipocalin-like domain-containing protein n=1 Tax=Fibrisoma limi BUZ 3 TaxID=1185876 RepID=I2GGP9_9BACT|nr:hypothetical protein [Fibrisoma limi]CCH53074.1 hypothetical protein BN8_02137 [Fibrisoma limi BUZ 3]
MTYFRALSTLTWFIAGCLLFSACQNSDDPSPGTAPEQLIVNKWWCPTGVYAQQYFNSDGSWQQRLRTTDSPDTGKWAFSPDKKTITISDVKGGTTPQLITQWSYTITKLESESLDLTFSGIAISYKPCP